ncbi:hypothetical protein AA313_de0202478 [Arthrobotrys entomopaga]|nr:hypothetical protein AA313_de0202478 [Arthrobotrys entomopaga]
MSGQNRSSRETTFFPFRSNYERSGAVLPRHKIKYGCQFVGRGNESYKNLRGESDFDDDSAYDASSLISEESFGWPRVKPYDDVRPYEILASQGYALRMTKSPAKDVSQEGSDIVLDKNRGYLFGTFTKKDPDLIDNSFLIPYYQLGKSIPTHLGETDIDNSDIVGPDRLLDRDLYRFTDFVDDGLLVVNAAYKNRDLANPKEEKFSEILYRVWYDAVRRNGKGVTTIDSLRYVIMNWVVNLETLATAREIFETLARQLTVVDFTTKHLGEIYRVEGHHLSLSTASGDPDVQQAINAIIGTQNGKGVARMLLDHSHALKNERITWIHIVKLTQPVQKMHILFKIDKLPPKPLISADSVLKVKL